MKNASVISSHRSRQPDIFIGPCFLATRSKIRQNQHVVNDNVLTKDEKTCSLLNKPEWQRCPLDEPGLPVLEFMHMRFVNSHRRK